MLRAGLRDRELRKFPFCDISLQIVPSILKSIDDAAVVRKHGFANHKPPISLIRSMRSQPYGCNNHKRLTKLNKSVNGRFVYSYMIGKPEKYG